MYYNSKMYDSLVSSRDVGIEQPLPEELNNVVINCNSKSLPIPDNCVHLVVTSPPYNASKDYDDDLSLSDYQVFCMMFLQSVIEFLLLAEEWLLMLQI